MGCCFGFGNYRITTNEFGNMGAQGSRGTHLGGQPKLRHPYNPHNLGIRGETNGNVKGTLVKTRHHDSYGLTIS